MRAFAMVFALAFASPVSAAEVAAGPGFTVKLQEGTTLQSEPARLDFAISRVVLKGKMLVGIYSGNAPQVDIAENDPNPLVTRDDDGEVNIVWKVPCQWPSRLHIWYDGQGPDAAMAKAIAESVRPAEKCEQ